MAEDSAQRVSDRVLTLPNILSMLRLLGVPLFIWLLVGDQIVAVSPLIRGAALKGPADRLMRELGYAATSVGVASYYRDLVGTFILDEADSDEAHAVRDLGMDVRVTTTVMANPEHATRLATEVLS